MFYRIPLTLQGDVLSIDDDACTATVGVFVKAEVRYALPARPEGTVGGGGTMVARSTVVGGGGETGGGKALGVREFRNGCDYLVVVEEIFVGKEQNPDTIRRIGCSLFRMEVKGVNNGHNFDRRRRLWSIKVVVNNTRVVSSRSQLA